MSEITTNVGLVVDLVTNTAGDVITMITSQPLLLIPIALGFVATGVAFIKKLKK